MKKIMSSASGRGTSRLLAFVGVLGSLIAVGADIALGYDPDSIEVFDSLFSLSVMQVYPVFSDTPHWRLLWSNYLAVIGIPLGFLGLLFVYRQFNSRRSVWALLCLSIGAIGYLAGTIFHASLSYIATLFRYQTDVGDAFPRMLVEFASFSQPFAYTFLIALFLVSLLFAYAVLRNWTSLPRLFGLVNPLSIQLLLAVIALSAGPGLKTTLIISIYNLSLALFYAGVLIVTVNRE